MNQWAFVTAAYVVGIGGTILTTLWAYIAMRRAERKGER
jgi:hypothetical protein